MVYYERLNTISGIFILFYWASSQQAVASELQPGFLYSFLSPSDNIIIM